MFLSDFASNLSMWTIVNELTTLKELVKVKWVIFHRLCSNWLHYYYHYHYCFLSAYYTVALVLSVFFICVAWLLLFLLDNAVCLFLRETLEASSSLGSLFKLEKKTHLFLTYFSPSFGVQKRDYYFLYNVLTLKKKKSNCK